MIKRILIAMDGSPSAEAGLSIAGSVAGIIGAELVGLFVEDSARFTALKDPAEIAKVETAVEAESLKLYQSFQARCASANIEGRFLSLRGDPDAVIRERTKTVDFVVMGNSGTHAGVETKRQGATMESLLASLARPVLIVPADVAGEPKIVIAYDGTLPSDRALRAAAEFAEISEMDDLHLLTVSKTVEECQTVQAPALEYLSSYDVHVTPICLTGSPEEAIIAYIEQVDASVVVIAAFGPNRVKESVFGSTTEAVVKNAQAAVLLVG